MISSDWAERKINVKLEQQASAQRAEVAPNG